MRALQFRPHHQRTTSTNPSSAVTIAARVIFGSLASCLFAFVLSACGSDATEETTALVDTTSVADSSTEPLTSEPLTSEPLTSEPVTTEPVTSSGTVAPDTSSPTPAPTSGEEATCQSIELAGSLGDPDPGAGNLYQPLVVNNIGPRPCTLEGFPGVVLLDASGATLDTATQRSEGERVRVSLAPGASASALLHTTNGPIGGPCVEASTSIKLMVTPPSDALTFPAVFTACGGLSVRAWVPGPMGV